MKSMKTDENQTKLTKQHNKCNHQYHSKKMKSFLGVLQNSEKYQIFGENQTDGTNIEEESEMEIDRKLTW